MTEKLMATEIQIVGFYKILPTEESIVEAARYHEYDWLLDEDGNYTDEINWDNHENLGLVELQVFGNISPPEFYSSISQEDQVPYMEFWLDTEGSCLLTEDEAITKQGRRVCFFLHFIDHSKPLAVSGKKLTCPSCSTLPERLSPFTHYIPVD